ncbi:GPCR fungal pheromone mating factor [Vararia minispora EC-137]|uniref:GPCR fungal pheromone mating factor n=1 Tax=Vararia minispora EC-137 TaxID=1314806 RepID=A0ACB8QCT3_9AGAM|nr:GPCR fungal pheromone mating factor [Vararia minispora EC-137]
MTWVARSSWSIGVTILTISLFVSTLTLGVNSIVWADNADIKAEVYSIHVQMFVSVARPACSLTITHQLAKIASLRTIEPAKCVRQRRVDLCINLGLGLVLPILVTGVFFYIVQGVRFSVVEGFGCMETVNVDVVELMLVQLWQIILPLVSILVYCPQIIYTFYRHARATNEFLSSNTAFSRAQYFRVLMLACVDAFITLPFGIANTVLLLRDAVEQNGGIPLYWGWAGNHENWAPTSFAYADAPPSSIAQARILFWESVVLGYATFALFGLTREARTTYRAAIRRVVALVLPTTPGKPEAERKLEGERSLSRMRQTEDVECHSIG